jgi:hypothetical protein
MMAIDEWALARRMKWLKLTTMLHNERAIALYRKLGYVVEGVRRDSIRDQAEPVGSDFSSIALRCSKLPFQAGALPLGCLSGVTTSCFPTMKTRIPTSVAGRSILSSLPIRRQCWASRPC